MFLDLVEAALRNPTGGILTPEQVRNVAFSKPPLGKPGYREAEVDAILDRVEQHLTSQQGAFSAPPQLGAAPPGAEPIAGHQTAAPGERVRCVLREIFNRRTLWRNALRLDFTGSCPALAIDLGDDAIQVIDLTTNALIASARLAQVTATPKEHTVYRDSVFRETPSWPVLVVGVPGVQPLTIGPLPLGFESYPNMIRRGRYGIQGSSWRIAVPTAKYPSHVVTNAEWQTLVERFGLAPRLDSRQHF